MSKKPSNHHMLVRHDTKAQPPTDSAQFNLPDEWVGRAIMLLDLDAFFASVEQLDHPAWRGKPVIVGGNPEARGVVSTASYEARTYGVHSAMPSSTAKRLCPNAFWTPGRFSRYREISRQVMSIMEDESPALEQVSIDEAFLDITPSRAQTEHPAAIAQRIQQRVCELGITCSIGLGRSKAIAKTASEAHKPRGLTIVPPGYEEAFLADLPTKAMSGIGPAAQQALRKFGITTLGQVAQADDVILNHVFGKNASLMRDRCRGCDDSPVTHPAGAKSVSNEMSFAVDLTSREDIEAALSTVAAKVGRRMRMNGLVGSTLSLKLRRGDFSVHSAQCHLDTPCDDEYVITPILFDLLDRVWRPGDSVRLVGCALTHIEEVGAPLQETLFDVADEAKPDDSSTTEPNTQAAQRARMKREDVRAGLKAATDSVRDRFGETALQYGSELRTTRNLTGSSSKNPADYRSTR